MNRAKIIFILILIINLAFLLRVYLLTQIPNSISGDEAAFGYNAYSILKTGRDEFGYKYPLYFRSFDDYKNPVFGYLLVPFIAIFGLNEWSIRLPSVITGTLTVLLFFLVTDKLTNKKKLSLITAFFACISPWLIQYSRVAIDTELTVFISLLGLWLFLQGKNQKLLYLICAVTWAIAFYTYYSSKLWTVIFGAFLIIINKSFNKYLLFACIIFALLVLPYFKLLHDSDSSLRAYAVSVFANKEQENNEAKLILSDKDNNIPGGKLVHNRRLTFINQAINGYLKILSPEILFSQSSYNQIASTRLFYLWEIPLMVTGCFYLLRNRYLTLFFAVWLFIGFLPGGLTNLPVFDRRIILNSYPLIFLASYGLYFILQELPVKTLPVKTITAILIIISFYFYIHNYFIHGRKEVVYLWGNGMKEVVLATKNIKHRFDQVIVSMRLNVPLTYFLFYEKYSPEKYQKEGGTVSGGFLEERNRFDKYRFRYIQANDLSQNNLYVWHINESLPNLIPLTTIYMSNGEALAQIGVSCTARCDR